MASAAERDSRLHSLGVHELEAAFAPLRAAAFEIGLPGLEEGASYGTPALKVRGKLIARLKDAETLVLRCPLDEKEHLMELEPETFFETDHYKGWPAVLIRLSRVEPAKLRQLLERAWRTQAPKRLVSAYDSGR
jgi:hypothetical protein